MTILFIFVFSLFCALITNFIFAYFFRKLDKQSSIVFRMTTAMVTIFGSFRTRPPVSKSRIEYIPRENK